MEDREKNKKILFIVLGVVLIVLLFFLIKSCSNGKSTTDDGKTKITNIDVKTETLSLEVGESDTLSYSILPSNTTETTKWVSSDESVVTVDAKGKITALKNGNALVSLVSENGVSDYTVIKVVSKTTVDGSAINISLTEKDVTLKVGASKALLFNIEPKDTQYNEVTWESSNNLVASVTDSGNVTAIRSGVTTVTVKVILNDNSVITDSATVTVEDNASLYLTNNIEKISKGEVFRVSAALSDASVSLVDGNVKSSSDKVASISNINTDNSYLTFDVTGVKEGNATLKLSATTSDGKNLALDVPITVEGYTDLYISTGDKELKIGENLVLSGRLIPAVSGGMNTICTSSNTKIATVSGIDPEGEYNGSCQITAIAKGTTNVSINVSGEKKTVKITVVETSSGTPDDGTDPDGTDGTTATLQSLEATLDKTTYERNAQMGVLTVNAVDSAGKKTALTSTEYVLINDFDSSTLGSKTLNIAYTKDGVTKTTAVSYTITGTDIGGGGSSGSGSGGYGGGSSSGSGGGGGGGGGGDHTTTGDVPYTKSDFKISSTTHAQPDGTYKGAMQLEATVQGTIPANTHFYAILIECSEPASTRTTECNENSSDFVRMRAYEGSPVNGKITYDIPSTNDAGTVVALTGGSWDPLSFYTEADGHTIKSGTYGDNHIPFKTGLLNNTEHWLYLTDGNGNPLLFSTVAGVGPSQSTNAGNLGKIIITPTKFWFKSPIGIGVKVDVKTTTAAYKIQSVTVAGRTVCTGSITTCLQTITVNATDNKVTGSATFIDPTTNATETVSTTIEINIDNIAPECKATLSANQNSISVRAYELAADRTKDSGILSLDLTGPSGSGAVASTAGATEFSLTKNYSITQEAAYSFKVTDKAGNTGTCGVSASSYYCFQDMVCGEVRGGSKEDCNKCAKAGCKDSRLEVHHLYSCKNASNVEKELYIDGYGPDTAGNLTFPTTISNYPYNGETLNCTIKTEQLDTLCYLPGVAKKDDVQWGNALAAVGQAAGAAGSDFSFNNNCKLCGCADGKWKPYNALSPNGNVKPGEYGATETFTSVRKIVQGSDSLCNNIVDGSQPEYLCSQGSKINSPIPECQ